MLRNSAKVPQNQEHAPNEMACGILNNFREKPYFPKRIYASDDKGFSSDSDGIETKATGWMARGSNPGKGKLIFLFFKTSNLTLEHSQPTFAMVTGFLSRR